MDRGVLIELDSRRRLSMRRLAEENDRYFLAQKRSDGTILLTPADVAPRRPAKGSEGADLTSEEGDPRDRLAGEPPPKEGSWWEQRRHQQRPESHGE